MASWSGSGVSKRGAAPNPRSTYPVEFVMPPAPPSVEGQFIPAIESFASVENAHAPESAALLLLGTDPSIADLNPEWVVKRLMRESIDYGSRTRQSSRVAALSKLAEIMQLTGEGLPKVEDPVERATRMDPDVRRKAIVAKAREMMKLGLLKPSDLVGDD